MWVPLWFFVTLYEPSNIRYKNPRPGTHAPGVTRSTGLAAQLAKRDSAPMKVYVRRKMILAAEIVVTAQVTVLTLSNDPFYNSSLMSQVSKHDGFELGLRLLCGKHSYFRMHIPKSW